MIRKPTASSLERAMACPASCVLPAVTASSDDADRGTAIHVFIRSVIAGTDHALALAAVPEEYRATCKGIRFKDLVGDLSDVEAEQAWALDAARGCSTKLGLNLGRDYPPTNDWEFTGSNDWAGVRLDGAAVICDAKTGQPVTSCQENPQMLFHTRAAQLATGATEVEGRLIYIREDGGVYVDSHTFTSFELDCFGDELAELPLRLAETERVFLETGSVTVNSGSWCRYCESLQACPKYTALAKTMLPELADVKDRLAIMTPAQQGVAWSKVTEILTLADEVKEGLKAIARQSAIPLPDPRKEVKETSSHNTSFGVTAAIELLRTKGVTQAEIDGLYRRVETKPVKVVNRAGVSKARKGRAA